jgi:hypothetical protein
MNSNSTEPQKQIPPDDLSDDAIRLLASARRYPISWIHPSLMDFDGPFQGTDRRRNHPRSSAGLQANLVAVGACGMTTITFRDDGSEYLDTARCVFCRESGADVQMLCDEKHFAYVCGECLRGAHRGLAHLARRLKRRAKQQRLLADRMERYALRLDNAPTDTELRFELQIYSDAMDTWTALGDVMKTGGGR